MEKWQKQHIQSNLVELIKNTVCSVELVSQLIAANILHQGETHHLRSPTLSLSEQSKHLYDIVQTRVNAYEILIESLGTTRQSGAVKILKEHQPSFKKFGCISYDKNHVLGKGSFGTKVYGGKFDGRDVAVKVLLCDQIEPARALAEIHLLKTLDSNENILRYYFAEGDDNYIYIALEMCVISLQDEVKIKMMNIPPTTILRKCTNGISYLHQQNVIHRDIKPANILLGFPDQVKISDFGLSKQIPVGNSSVSVASGVVGTADWMAPEVLQLILGDNNNNDSYKMTFSSDIFSLGCVFYFTLTNGSHPFGNGFQRQFYIMEGRPQFSLSSLPTIWLEVIEQMVANNPKLRPSAMQILFHECFHLTNGEAADGYNNSSHSESQSNQKLFVTKEQNTQLSEKNRVENTEKELEAVHLPNDKPGNEGTMVSKLHEQHQESDVNSNYLTKSDEMIDFMPLLTQLLSKGINHEHPNRERCINIAIEAGHLSSDFSKITQHTSWILTAEEEQIIEGIFRLAFSKGVEPTWTNKRGQSFFKYAAAGKQNVKVFEMLIDLGVSALTVDSAGDTCAHYAAASLPTDKFHELICMLICKNFDSIFHLKNNCGETPLHLALKHSKAVLPETIAVLTGIQLENCEFIETEMDSCVNLNDLHVNGVSILHYAVVHKVEIETVKKLVEFGANWNLKDSHGANLALISASERNWPSFKYFAELGCNVKESDDNGDTALHRAVDVKQSLSYDKNEEMVSIVLYLINKKVDLGAKNKLGRTAREHAFAEGYLDSRILFLIKP